MKMENLGFEFSLNGKPVCKAGFDTEHYVLAGVLTVTSTEHNEGEVSTNHRLGGLAERNHVEWSIDDLSVGDRLKFKVIKGPFDPFNSTSFTPEELQLAHKKSQYNHLKKLLGDRV